VILPSGRRVRRKKSHRRGHIRLFPRCALATAALLLVLATGWLGLNRADTSYPNQPVQTSSNETKTLAVLAGPTSRPVEIKKSDRPVYNYSVVPGGVRGAAELRDAVLRDPQVAEHYAGFRFDRARVVHLEQATLVYLSYRKKGQIFWTKKRHPLKAGERVITDGNITGRTRCANRISVRKQLAVSPEPDPSAVELDQIEAPASLPPALVTYPAQYQTALLASPGDSGSTPTGPGTPPMLGSGPSFPPFFSGGGGGGTGCESAADEKREKDSGMVDDESKEKDCPTTPPVKPPVKPPGKPPKPPVAVPEPGTVELMVIGIAGLAIACWRKRAVLL
jgi:hypothetical protein